MHKYLFYVYIIVKHYIGIAVIGASCCDCPASCLIFLLMLCYCECDCVLVLCVVMFKSGKVNKLKLN